MNLFHKLSKHSKVHNAEQSLLTSVFIWAGLSLLGVFAIGMICWSIMLSSGVLAVLGDARFNWNIYSELTKGQEGSLRMLGILSVTGSVLILLSWILRLIWVFRFNTVSKQFIMFTYATFIIGQGIGFGFLFATWNAPDLLAIFGITGALFGVMALVGIFAKNLSGLLPYLIGGAIMVFFLAMLNMILYFSGVYNNFLTFIVLTFSGLLALGYIAFDVWWIKRTSEVYKEHFLDKDSRFRLVAFFAFQLLTDIIWLLWVVIRLYGRSR